jgi:Tfp pilus assembly protein PilZ
MFIETEDVPPIGSRLKVRFRLPGGAAFHELEARVAWVMSAAPDAEVPAPSPGMGIAFMDSAATAALAHELDREPSPPT